MAISILSQPLRFFALFFILSGSAAGVFAQTGYYKVYPTVGYNAFQKVLPATENETMFITTSELYKVDGTGRIVWKKELREGVYSSLESLIKDQEGNFWIASIVFVTQDDSRKVLYKIAPDGQVLKTINFNDPNSFENIRLTASANNQFFMSYQDRTPDGAFIEVAMLDKNGNKLWSKRATDTIYNTYSVKAGPNGTADIFYQEKNSKQGLVTTVAPAGAVTETRIQLPPTAAFVDFTSDFCRVPGGGFVFAGSSEKSPPALSDALIYKTDAAGKTVWLRRKNIQRGDGYMKISAVADGFILAGMANREDWGSDKAGDIILTKIDADGTEVWNKAFGGAKMDYPRDMEIFNEKIFFGGQSSYPGQTTSVPMLCKTDKNGNIPDGIPFQLQASSTMKTITVGANQFPQTFVQAAVGENRTVIAGGNFLDPSNDEVYPFLVCSDLAGQEQWFKQLSNTASTLKLFRQIRNNEYIAVTEIKDVFSNIYDIYKLDKKGKISWSIRTGAGGINDVIATKDGGSLLVGTVDISFINFETILIKLDAAGNIQWHKTIGDLRLWETGRKIIETPEQDFLIAGNRQHEFDITSAIYILKIDRNGNKLWVKTFSTGVTTDLAYDVVLTADQQYLFAGSSLAFPSQEKDLIMIKTDKQGNLVWQKKQDIHLTDEGFRLINGSGGGYFIAGTTGEPRAGVLEKFVYVMKADNEGNRQWINYYGKEGEQTRHPALLPTPWGDTLLFGTSQSSYEKQVMFLAKLNDRQADPVGEPEEEISLYPNPASSSTTLRMKQAATGAVFLQLFDQSGKAVKQWNREKNGLILQEDLVLTGIAPGVYYVRIFFNGKTVTKKLLFAVN